MHKEVDAVGALGHVQLMAWPDLHLHREAKKSNCLFTHEIK